MMAINQEFLDYGSENLPHSRGQSYKKFSPERKETYEQLVHLLTIMNTLLINKQLMHRRHVLKK